LEDMKAQVAKEGTSESETYEKFSCFCKSKSDDVSKLLFKGRDSTQQYSADFEAKSAEVTRKQDALKEAIEQKIDLEENQKDAQAALVKATSKYEKANADYVRWLKALDDAISVLQAAEGSSKANLIAVDKAVQNSLALAEAMKLVNDGPKWSSISALLQKRVDPDDPEYKFHSQDILQVLSKLRADFVSQKKAGDDEWEEIKKELQNRIDALTEKLQLNSKTRQSLEEEIDGLIAQAASTRGNLVEAAAQLRADQSYMKELTNLCETRSKEWDQRTQMRAGELDALTKALTLMTDKVKKASAATSEGLFFVQSRPAENYNKIATARVAGRTNRTNSSTLQATQNSTDNVHLAPMANVKRFSFLQKSSVETHMLDSSSQKQRTARAIDTLRQEGRRLRSTKLSLLVMRAAADPFAKVGEMLQDLIERLLQEATDEATQKGFCDTQLTNNRQARDKHYKEVKSLSTEIGSLKAKQEELEMEMEDLTGASGELSSALDDATKNREAEKADNMAAIKTAQEGLDAVTEAMTILKDFYRQAARAGALLQGRATPLQSDDPGVNFKGAYTGKQSSATGVIAMLEIVQSDFQRVLKNTKAVEEEAAAEFIKFSGNSMGDQKGKDTKLQVDRNELAKTKSSIAAKLDEMKTNMGLMDGNLKELQQHNSLCIDTGKSYAQRKQSRDDEIAALKKALCQLDVDGVEDRCK